MSDFQTSFFSGPLAIRTKPRQDEVKDGSNEVATAPSVSGSGSTQAVFGGPLAVRTKPKQDEVKDGHHEAAIARPTEASDSTKPFFSK